MINDDWCLDNLIRQWGLERINRAVQPLFIAIDADNQAEAPDCATRRRLETPILVVNASVNDPDLWNSLNPAQQNTLLLVCNESVHDVDALANDLYDILELPDDQGCDLSGE
ncbi:MAG: hypothetical protein H7Z72_13565 [Bacteroidetes bacterium]|nr:hypothetical protein [Fibrella sp.]